MGTSSVTPGFDESALVARAKAGDDEAFAELVKHYDRRVFRMAKQITQNDDDAEDVLQETFLKAYTHLDNFQGNSKFYTWVVRIAVNEALMKLRKPRSDRTVPLDEPIDRSKRVTEQDQVGRQHHDERNYEDGCLDERNRGVNGHRRQREQQRRDNEQRRVDREHPPQERKP